MRCMVIVKATQESEAGVLPEPQRLLALEKFNEELARAGVLLAAEGLRPTAKSARIHFAREKIAVTYGPYSDRKDLVAGYWILQVKSQEEALEWIKHAPLEDGEVEIRQLHEPSDFDAVDPTGQVMEAEKRLRQSLASKS